MNLSEGCHNTCTYNSCLYNDPIACLLRACAFVYCVRDCLLRVRACACVTACQGLIGVLSLGNLSRKPRCNALSINDLHLHLEVESGWLLFLVYSLVASNVKA
jgi:hypothetical protein